MNGSGNYRSCQTYEKSSYTGTFKENLKEKGVQIKYYKMKNGFYEVSEYYDGQFQNEMRNGKGIYYSSYDKENIYEGIWKDDKKNGAFIVYTYNGNGDSISEKGIVSNSSSMISKKITYVNNTDKVDIERQRKQDLKFERFIRACGEDCFKNGNCRRKSCNETYRYGIE